MSVNPRRNLGRMVALQSERREKDCTTQDISQGPSTPREERIEVPECLTGSKDVSGTRRKDRMEAGRPVTSDGRFVPRNDADGSGVPNHRIENPSDCLDLSQ